MFAQLKRAVWNRRELNAIALLEDTDVVVSDEVTRWVCGSPTSVRVGANPPLKSTNNENKWKSCYTKLEAHKVKHGDRLVSRNHGLPLYWWATRQRIFYLHFQRSGGLAKVGSRSGRSNCPGTITQERVTKLEVLGFVWAVDKRTANKQAYERTRKTRKKRNKETYKRTACGACDKRKRKCSHM